MPSFNSSFNFVQILLDVEELFKAQPSLIDVAIPENSKFTVCGDIHGQFYDLMNIFKLNGPPSTENPYVRTITSILISYFLFTGSRFLHFFLTFHSFSMEISSIEVLFLSSASLLCSVSNFCILNTFLWLAVITRVKP